VREQFVIIILACARARRPASVCDPDWNAHRANEDVGDGSQSVRGVDQNVRGVDQNVRAVDQSSHRAD
jgi:hypothetical protein